MANVPCSVVLSSVPARFRLQPWRPSLILAFIVVLAGLVGQRYTFAQTSPLPGEWTWMSGSNTVNQGGVYGTLGVSAANNVPGARSIGASWTDSSGNLWLFGGFGDGEGIGVGELNDLWKYAPSTGQWTWMGGSGTPNRLGVYGTLGVPSANIAPGGRSFPVSWMDSSGNLWLFGGYGLDSSSFNDQALNDLWMYTPSTGQWTWMGGSDTWGQNGVYGTTGVPAEGNIPGARFLAVNWTDASGNFWLFGGAGLAASGGRVSLNDLWKYTPSTGQWTWMGGSNTGAQRGVYGTLGVPAAGNTPGARGGAVSWTDVSGNLWLFGGFGLDAKGAPGNLNDLWVYTPSTGQWTWMSGSNTGGQSGVYGTQGVPAAGNMPGARYNPVSWTDSSGNLWLSGGNIGGSYLNDIWKYTPSTGEWTWMSGSNTANQPGVYGTQGVSAAGNVPGARFQAFSWTDSSGNLWLFGGYALDKSSSFNVINDLWVYPTSGSAPRQAAAPVFSTPSGEYVYGSASLASVTITDATPGAQIQYSTDNGSTWQNYSGPLTISASVTISAQATASGYTQSSVSTGNYVVDAPQPSVSVPPGYYSGISAVALTDALPGATIYYTTDGTTPTTSSAVYTSPLAITASETVNAIAVAPGYPNSLVASFGYIIESDPQTTGEWTWVGGSNLINQAGSFGNVGVPLAANMPGAHAGAASTWTDKSGNLWLFGGYGRDANRKEGYLNDLWKYIPSTGTWTWMGGSNSVNAAGIYGSKGIAATSNFPGARCLSTTWVDANGNFWLLGGYGLDSNGNSGQLNDLWTYNPASGQWTWMTGANTINSAPSYGTQNAFAATNTPGARFSATGWVSGGRLWLFGGYSYDANGVDGYANDVWAYDPAQNQWEWAGGSNTLPGAGQGVAAVRGARYAAAAANTPGGRDRSASWTDANGNLWLFGGYNGAAPTGDLWMFNPASGQWAWYEGGYGDVAAVNAIGAFSPTNLPWARSDAASWVDANGNFWLFGGYENARVHDLWVFNPRTQLWAVMDGVNPGPGVYGAKGVAAPENTPSPRTNAAAWTDNKGNLWLLGGEGTDATCQPYTSCAVGYLNDLWEFQTPAIH